jgi:hypothetical protein
LAAVVVTLITHRQVLAWQDVGIDRSATIRDREEALAAAITGKDKARLEALRRCSPRNSPCVLPRTSRGPHGSTMP